MASMDATVTNTVAVSVSSARPGADAAGSVTLPPPERLVNATTVATTHSSTYLALSDIPQWVCESLINP